MIEVRIHQRGARGTYQAFASLPGNHQFRQSLRTTDEETAKRKAREIEAQLNSGVRPDAALTVEEWLRLWVTELRREGRQPNTLRSYERIAKQYIKPRIGRVRLVELTVADVQRMDADLLEHGGRGGRALDPVTVKQAHDMLAAAIHEAERQSLVIRNVASLARRPKQPHRTPRWLERDEALRLFEAAPGHAWGAFVAVGALTGLRAGELCGLRWEDVDFERGELRVQRQRRYDGPDIGYVDAAPKSHAGVRVVPLCVEARQWLEAVQAHQAQAGVLLGKSPSLWVFSHRGRGATRGQWLPWTPQAAARGVGDLYRSVGLEVPKRPIHALRHTTGTLLADASADPKVRAALLGHADVKTTYWYTHASRASRQQAMAGVGSALRKTGEN